MTESLACNIFLLAIPTGGGFLGEFIMSIEKDKESFALVPINVGVIVKHIGIQNSITSNELNAVLYNPIYDSITFFMKHRSATYRRSQIEITWSFDDSSQLLEQTEEAVLAT